MTLAVFHGYLQQIKLASFCHGFDHYPELQCEKTGLREFQPGVTQNWPVYLQKMARSLKFWIYVEEELYYLKSENKCTDQLCSFFVFAWAKIRFSRDTAHLYSGFVSKLLREHESANSSRRRVLFSYLEVVQACLK